MKREIEFQELNDEQLDQVVGGNGHRYGGYSRQSNQAFIINAPVSLNINVLGFQKNNTNQSVYVNQSNWR